MRSLLVLLLLANAAFFAWTQGWLAPLGLQPDADREPGRLLRQLRADEVTVLPPQRVMAPPPAPVAVPASAAASTAAGATSCLEAGPFAAEQAGAALAVLQTAQPPLPPGSWRELLVERPGMWMVYMGRYTAPELLARKEEELRRTRVTYEPLRAPSELAPGFSLGRYNERAAAERALEQLSQRGVRTARVIELVAPVSQQLLRIDRADPTLAAQLLALRAEALGRGFVACSSP